MLSLLLAIIYIAFISLGLPDSLLGAAWPTLHTELSVPLSFAGIITMIISGGTILSSLLSDRVTKKFGTGLVTAVSVLLTAVALLGFSLSDAMWMLCLWAIPYGLGCAPIYPSIIHATPRNFGKENSQAIVGIQMASAYVGSTFMPPLFGALTEILPIGIYPFYLAVFAGLMAVMSERLNKLVP
ncbi:MAG: MFS transporter [Clostridia bacterium]|nr:MFS transporter [Clostridia bacterium]